LQFVIPITITNQGVQLPHNGVRGHANRRKTPAGGTTDASQVQEVAGHEVAAGGDEAEGLGEDVSSRRS